MLMEKKDSMVVSLVTIIAVVATIYHAINARWLIFSLDQHKAIHIGVAIVLVFLMSTQGKSLVSRTVSFVLAALGAGTAVYVVINYYSMQERMGVPVISDTILGLLLIVLVLEATRRSWGPIIPGVVLISMSYALFGQYLPGILFHGGISVPRLIAYSSTYFQGIYGTMTSAGSMEVFMFVLLGSLLEASGGIDFFMKVAMGIGSRFRSGPAQTAVIASGCMGTVSGSIAANVVTTGTVTIPLMIKTGLSREFAGAVETCASTGGQLMPPVMGVAAFLISATTNTPYITICKMALFPALVFYIYLAVSIQVRAVKMNLPMGKKESHTKQALKENGYLMLFLPVLIWLLAIRTPAAVAALYTCIVLVILVTVNKLYLYRSDLNKFFSEMKSFFVTGLKDGAIQGTKIGLILGCLGIMIELFVVTGFAQKISFQMLELSGGILPLLLFYVALTCLLFGMGMPTTGAYLVVSILAAPALVNYGINLVAAHLFVFYYGLMASVTPPVGIGAIVAAGISKGNYLKTGLIATRLAMPGFILPIFFIYRPEILWINTNFSGAFVAFLSALIGCICLSCIMEWHYIVKLKVWHAALFAIAVALMFEPGITTSIIGFGIFGFTTWVQMIERKKSLLVCETAAS